MRSIGSSRYQAIALALVCACGGTTGLGALVASPVDDGGDDASTGQDASVNRETQDGERVADVSAPDVGAERIRRPPPRETGVSFTPGHTAPGKDASLFAVDSGAVTTLTLLAAQGPDCLSFEQDGGPAADACAVTSGCLDPAQLGGTCETPPDGAIAPASGSADYTQMCLTTLHDIFASNCAAGPLVLTPCVCGTTDPATCLVGSVAPSGNSTWQDYVNDFGTTDPRAIESKIVVQNYGSGQANALVQCLAISGCTACLGSAAGDAAAAGD
jgi:hypothetical protein